MKKSKKSELITVLITEIEMRNAYDGKVPQQVKLVFNREQVEGSDIDQCIDCALEEFLGELPGNFTQEIL